MVAGNLFVPPRVRTRQPMELTLRQARSSRLDALLRSPLRLEVGTAAASAAAVAAVVPLLDRVHEGLDGGGGEVSGAMTDLFAGLYALRRQADPAAWRDVVKRCADHPVMGLVHHDPFTARSYHKPRGYAGDAVLIDYIYDNDPGTADPSPVGRTIFDFTTSAPASAGVRTRRDLMAAVIDQTCATVDHPDVLSVACGHLREAGICRSVRAGLAGRFVALDQDPASLDEVDARLGDFGVVTICASIKALFRGELAGEKFDLVYSTGLYDYLDDRLATRLTARLFEMLNPGGRLVVANFLPDVYVAAFMEAFMGWDLIYRSPEQADALAAAIPSERIGDRRTFVEKNANIVFLDLTRR